MKNIAIIIFVLLILVILALVFTSFQVRETESALVIRFGKPVRQFTEPGWRFKWPPPIEWVYKYDSRMRVLEAEARETTTKGAVPIIVKTYVVWRIADPCEFLMSVTTAQKPEVMFQKAEEILLDQISDSQNSVIGQYSFGEFVNSDPNKIKFEKIQNQILEDLQEPVRKNYGIEIKALGIKQLKVSKDVSKEVFDRMRTERQRRTETTISQGMAEATRIKKDAEFKRAVLLAAAEARAKAIRGQGDAEAAKYYKMLEEDPEFAMFLRDIEALKKILGENSTVVLSGDIEPLKLLKQMPALEPKNQ